ncbi:MAG: calcium-binding EGF-like domain-containing protein [Saprospiraceae bacterium]|nr:calcium-binding EGF-like domain-containing protein [Saprospiraceae bacterium]
MKKLTGLFLFFLLVGSSCSKSDPCESLVCQNDGSCVDGKCQCPEGWEGTLCETESLPNAVVVTNIKVPKFPDKKSNGSNWDADNTGPDLFTALYTLKEDNTTDQVLWISDVIKLNVVSGKTHEFSIVLPKLAMNNYEKKLGFFLWDKDDGASETMGGIAFKLQDVIKGRPDSFILDCSTCKVAFELAVKYE